MCCGQLVDRAILTTWRVFDLQAVRSPGFLVLELEHFKVVLFQNQDFPFRSSSMKSYESVVSQHWLEITTAPCSPGCLEPNFSARTSFTSSTCADCATALSAIHLPNYWSNCNCHTANAISLDSESTTRLLHKCFTRIALGTLFGNWLVKTLRGQWERKQRRELQELCTAYHMRDLLILRTSQRGGFEVIHLRI